jgi:hypothetical protein
MRLPALVLLIALGSASCQTQPTRSAGEMRIEEVARERRKGERFPVLTRLPSEAAVIGEVIPEGTGPALIQAAESVTEARELAEASLQPDDEEAVAAELRALVQRVQRPWREEPSATREDLGFPVPPPLDSP